MKFRPKKANFPNDAWAERRAKANADDRLPVKNMVDHGCTDDVIKAPTYADRSYQICCPVGQEEFSKITGQIQNVRTPSMLAKARLHKDAFQSPDRMKATPGKDPTTFSRSEEKQRPFFGPRKKKR
jgi:hypothetical protein